MFVRLLWEYVIFSAAVKDKRFVLPITKSLSHELELEGFQSKQLINFFIQKVVSLTVRLSLKIPQKAVTYWALLSKFWVLIIS